MIEYLSPVAETPFPDDWYAFADASHFWMQWRLAVTLQLCGRVGVPQIARCGRSILAAAPVASAVSWSAGRAGPST